MSTQSSCSRIGILDGMRLAAALAVLGFHYAYSGIYGGKLLNVDYAPGAVAWLKYGYLGVEFFFLISGYVIFRSAQGRNFASFAIGRLLRLYPAYWASVALTTLVTLLVGHARLQVGAGQFFANLTMLAKSLGYPYVDGVYWTLAYELNFYALVSLFLLLGLGGQLRRVFLIWSVLIALGELVLNYRIPFSSGYYAYFAAGACFYMVQQRPSVWAICGLAMTCVSAWLFSVGHGISAFGERLPAFSVHAVSGIVWSMYLFFSLLVAGALPRINGPFLRTAGGVSYPLYLLHAHIGFALVSKLAPDIGGGGAYVLTVGSVLMLALFVHLVVERSWSGFWRGLLFTLLLPLLNRVEGIAARARGAGLAFIARGVRG